MDQELLAKAKRAEERLVEAEHDAEVARAEFHRAVRRLHLRGASLRELASALDLSHQRIHQIVESAGGGRRWRRGRQPPMDIASAFCSFCSRPQRKTRKLIAGPDVYICEACVDVAGRVVATGQAADTPQGAMKAVPNEARHERCSFCGKRRLQVAGLAAIDTDADNTAAICSECVTLCGEIIGEAIT